MPESLGLQMEAKCLSVVNDLKERNWSFNGYYICKAVRTFPHHRSAIKKKDGKKIDLIIAFKKDSDKSQPLIFVLQVKSTRKSYEKFCNNANYKKNIKCILVRPREPMREVAKDLDCLFKEVLSLDCKKNPFLRPKIPFDQL